MPDTIPVVWRLRNIGPGTKNDLAGVFRIPHIEKVYRPSLYCFCQELTCRYIIHATYDDLGHGFLQGLNMGLLEPNGLSFPSGPVAHVNARNDTFRLGPADIAFIILLSPDIFRSYKIIVHNAHSKARVPVAKRFQGVIDLGQTCNGRASVTASSYYEDLDPLAVFRCRDLPRADSVYISLRSMYCLLLS